jgi:hypothetical protein
MLVEEKACTACYVVMTINRQINFIRLFVNLCAVTFLVLKKHQYMFKCGNKFCKKKKKKKTLKACSLFYLYTKLNLLCSLHSCFCSFSFSPPFRPAAAENSSCYGIFCLFSEHIQ